jgi:hypothetical protein
MHTEYAKSVVAVVQRLLSEGYEPRRAWVTALFFTEGSPARALFNHKDYGIARSTSRARETHLKFYDHVANSPTTWFAGTKDTKPKLRMLKRARDTFDKWNDFARPAEELVHDALFLLTTPFAQDSKCAKGAMEGGPKMFCLASPWQILNAIPLAKSNRDDSIRAIGNIIWPGNHAFNTDWLKHGQPVFPYPTCSMYMPRSDETEIERVYREYFMTVDVDGINVLTKLEQMADTRTRDALCAQVVDLFTKSRDDAEPAILACLTSILVETFKRVCDASVKVSWHKTFGYKPSWRAYVVGIAFRDNYEAKAFVDQEIREKCLQMFKERLPEPFRNSDRLDKVVDCGTYADGWDRCLGSAKLNSENAAQMRFLRVQPLAELTDESLLTMFNECPNKYLLTVLGWMYPESVYSGSRPRTSFVWASEATAGTRSSKNKRTAQSPSTTGHKRQCIGVGDDQIALDVSQNNRLSDLVARSFEKHGFAHPTDASIQWSGEGGVLKNVGTDNEAFEIYAAPSELMLCVYRNCGFKKNDTPSPVIAPFNPKASMHSSGNSSAKIIYKISLRVDRQMWIRQNCHKCGGEFGYKMQYICPLVTPTAAHTTIKDYILGDQRSAADEQVELETQAHITPEQAPVYDQLTDALFIPNIAVVVNGIKRMIHI